MPQLKSYHLEPTALIPNSPLPLLHYPGLFKSPLDAGKIHSTFQSNGWNTQWLVRYGSTQRSHYHANTHEAMVVLSGTATIRFGAADTSEDVEANTFGTEFEQGGVEIEAKEGDVFLIPAGVSHKTHKTSPQEEWKLLSRGSVHEIEAEDGDVERHLSETKLSGFTMIGAYPRGYEWDSHTGGDHVSEEERQKVWGVKRPESDPVLGKAGHGALGLWR